MNTIVPKKIGLGAHLRVIAPSRNANIIASRGIEYAKNRLEALGFKISFGSHIFDSGRNNCSPVESRLIDLHEAFLDNSVDAILTMIGGYSSNQMLDDIDFEIIRNNPKIFCGFSDITVLQNAIYSQTGLVTYSGPHFSSWSMEKGFEYTSEYFKKCLMGSDDFDVKPSDQWSDDSWYIDQNNRKFYKNSGYNVINSGLAHGNVVGGNLSSFALLFGTKYFPSLDNSIIVIEDTSEITPEKFDSLITSLTQLNGFENVSGLMFGRFQVNTDMDSDKLEAIIRENNKLKNIPVLANVDIGHTTPIITFPIGGTMNLDLGTTRVRVTIEN